MSVLVAGGSRAHRPVRRGPGDARPGFHRTGTTEDVWSSVADERGMIQWET
jgi:hypothetical protein